MPCLGPGVGVRAGDAAVHGAARRGLCQAVGTDGRQRTNQKAFSSVLCTKGSSSLLSTTATEFYSLSCGTARLNGCNKDSGESSCLGCLCDRPAAAHVCIPHHQDLAKGWEGRKKLHAAGDTKLGRPTNAMQRAVSSRGVLKATRVTFIVLARSSVRGKHT